MSKNLDNKLAIEVKGRLMGMNDLVAKEVLLHKRCNAIFFSERGKSIIREHHNNKEDDDKTKIIKSAVKLIQNDIALVNMNSSLYPSSLLTRSQTSMDSLR